MILLLKFYKNHTKPPLSKGMFDTTDFTLPDKVLRKSELPETLPGLWDRVRNFMISSDLACSEIVVNQQRWREGDLAVIEVKEGGEEMTVGVVETVVVKKERVFLVMRTYETAKTSLGYYQPLTASVDISIKEVNLLADFKPLIKHGTTFQFQYVLHHHVSYSYQ